MTCPLTPRQVEAVVAAARGLTNAEISREMGVTEHTVKNFMTEAHHRSGTENRSHLVAKAIVERWIDPGTLF